MSKGMFQYMWTMTTKEFWHRFNCFSLFKAPHINSFLLWLMVGSLFFTYLIMYVLLPGNDIDTQWRVFLSNNGLDLFASSIIIMYAFNGTRNAGLATFWMIHCGILFAAALLGFDMQIFWFKCMCDLFMLAMAYYIIKDIRKRSKDEGKVL